MTFSNSVKLRRLLDVSNQKERVRFALRDAGNYGTSGDSRTGFLGLIYMTCAEFQKVLPYIIDGGGSEEEQQHLSTCHVCSDLVADLRYIAECAKLLVPMEEPSPRVWNGIQKSITQPIQARKH